MTQYNEYEMDMGDKSPEQLKFAANEILLKSKAFVLCTIDDSGKAVEHIVSVRSLSFIEQIGLYSYMRDKITRLQFAEANPPRNDDDMDPDD